MPATFEPLATTTLGSAASSITFSSIGSGYTDLVVVLVGRGTDTGYVTDGVKLTFNSDTANNYSETYLRGDGSSASSSRTTSFPYIAIRSAITGGDAGSGIFGLTVINVFSYGGSTFKTVLSSQSADANGSGTVTRDVGLWRSTSAITSLKLEPSNTTTFVSGSSATLYGIKAA